MAKFYVRLYRNGNEISYKGYKRKLAKFELLDSGEIVNTKTISFPPTIESFVVDGFGLETKEGKFLGMGFNHAPRMSDYIVREHGDYPITLQYPPNTITIKII